MTMHMSDKSEHQIRQMYESVIREARMVVWEYDSESHRLYIVNADEQSYTIRAGVPEVVENAPASLLPFVEPADQENFLSMYRAIDRGEARASCDVLFTPLPFAEARHVRMVMTNIQDEDGRRLRAFGFGQDISWLKKEEKVFRQLENQMAQVMGNSFATIHLDLTENRILRFESNSEEYRRHYGAFSADDLFHRVGHEIIEDDIRKAFFASVNRQNLLEGFRAGQDTVVWEYPIFTLAGYLCWIRSTLTMRRNPRTHSVEAVAYAQDMTEEKIREELFAKIGREHYNFVASLDIASRKTRFFSGPDGHNREGKGVEEDYDACVRRFATERVSPADQAEYLSNANLNRVLEGLEKKGRYRLEYRRQMEGEELEYVTEYTWLEEEYGILAIFCTDVTEIRREEKARLEKDRGLQLRAETASEAKMEFISRISHDIRTPIGAIQGLTDLALEDMNDPEKLRFDLENIRSSGKFLTSLVSDVLDVSKLDSGRVAIRPKPFKKKHAITDVANTFRLSCKEKGILFVAEADSKIRTVLADGIRIRQIMQNLISNAIRYTPAGGSIRYVVHQEKVGDGKARMDFSVRDTGIGMSKEYVAHCFEPFSQQNVDLSNMEEDRGTGLGLYIVQKLVNLMDGCIQVFSEEGVGTEITCSFVFPLAPKDGQSGAEPDENRPEYLCGRVLLVEDYPINARIAVRMLGHLGASVDCAVDGEEAVEMFRNSVPETYKLILMDIQMPRMNGYEATAAIRKSGHPDAFTIPIFAMTANAYDEAEQESLLAGMNGYLTKPIDRRKLGEILRRCMGPEE